jgi:nitroreductase
MVAYFHSEHAMIGAPAPRCYDLVLAVRRYAEWWPSVRCTPVGTEAALRVGSRIRCGAGPLRWTAELTRLAPYRSVELRCIDGDLEGLLGWDFDALSDGTRVRQIWRGVEMRGAAVEPSSGLAALLASIAADACAGMRRRLEDARVDVGGADLFDALHTQRAVRRFRPDPIPDAVLGEVIAAATRAPSARTAQPWFFVAVRDAALKAELAGLYLTAWRQAQAFTAAVDADADIKDRPDYDDMMRRVDGLAVELEHAPVLVLCCLDLSQLGPMADRTGHIRAPQSAYASIFPAVQNLMLAARGLGLGSTLTTVFLSAESDMRRVVGIPDHVHIAALVPLGYPLRPFRVTTRKPVDQVAFLDRWGNPLPKP